MELTGLNVALWGDSTSYALAAPIASAGARVVLLLPSGATAPRASGEHESFTLASATPGGLDALAGSAWAAAGRVGGLVVQPAFSIGEVPAGGDASAGLAASESSWHAALESALEVPFFLARSFAARMEAAGGGSIVFVSPGEKVRSDALVARVVREGTMTMALGLAKALPRSVRVHIVVAPLDREATSGVAESICFLLGASSLPSGTVVRLDRHGE